MRSIPKFKTSEGDEKGNAYRMVEACSDISERKQAEEELRQSEEKYRTILEEMQDGYFEVALAGNITFFNDAICRLLGYSEKELMGMNYRVFTTAEDVDKVYKTFNQVYRTGKPIRDVFYKIILKDGSKRFAETSVFPRRNDKGEIIGFRGVTHDVTERRQAEEALQAEKNKLQSLIGAMEDGLTIRDTDYNLIYQNEPSKIASGDHVGEKCYRALEGREKVCDGCPAEEAFRDGKSHTSDRRVVLPSGEVIFWENTASPVRDAEGRIVACLEIARNVTERKQAEEALRQSEERYRTVLDEMEESYYEVDIAGNFTFFNDAMCRQLGYSREELMGMSYRAITPLDNAKKVFSIYNQVYRTGESFKSVPIERIRKDGTRIFAESSVFPLRNERGELIGFRGIARDVTERMQMLEALRQSEERYRSVLEQMEEAYYEVDIAGNFTFFNDAMRRQLGYSREELLGMNYRVYTPKDDVQRMYKVFNQVYRAGKATTGVPINRIRKDGIQIFAEISTFPLQNEQGKIIGFRGIVRDITERKQAEEEKRQMEQKAQLASRLACVGELASGVAHEINNPLTGVIGYAHLLLDRKDIPRDIRHDLEIINEGAQRVAGIVRKLLTFARQQKPEQKLVDINEIISTTLDLRAYELASNNIRVTFQPARDLPIIIADPGQLQQVFLNLIINAETEMKLAHGKGKLSIKAEHIDNTIRISFKDNGPGIAKENLEKIFNPFFTTREVGQGTGLGLNLCHGIIGEHKGRIWAESRLGRGATFFVELPIVT